LRGTTAHFGVERLPGLHGIFSTNKNGSMSEIKELKPMEKSYKPQKLLASYRDGTMTYQCTLENAGRIKIDRSDLWTRNAQNSLRIKFADSRGFEVTNDSFSVFELAPIDDDKLLKAEKRINVTPSEWNSITQYVLTPGPELTIGGLHDAELLHRMTVDELQSMKNTIQGGAKNQ
jgi:hypothetical protein